MSSTYNYDKVTTQTNNSEKAAEIDVSSLWITNGSYFLKEHDIIVTHIAECDKIFLRLVSPNFSVNFWLKYLNKV
jgi:hypothetical protein